MSIPPTLNTALACAQLGWKTLPTIGKMPAAGDDWQHKATNDPHELSRLFDVRHDGLGVLLGQPSGIVDFEIDKPEGEETLLWLFGGEIPKTAMWSSTRGSHRLFKHSLSIPGCHLAKYEVGGLECRCGGEAAQSVIPPSGGRKWIARPDHFPPIEIPLAALDRLRELWEKIEDGKRTPSNQNGDAKALLLAPTNGEKLDVEKYLQRNNVIVLARDTGRDGAIRWFIPCPGQSSHTNTNRPRDCVITQEHDGRLGGHCLHTSCGMAGWQDIKDAIGPLTNGDYPKIHHANNGVAKKLAVDDPLAGLSFTKSRIELGTDEYRVNNQAAAALNADESLYQRGGQLVRVIQEPTETVDGGVKRPQGTLTIREVPKASLREIITRHAEFVWRTTSKDGTAVEKPDHPPQWCVDAVHHRGQWAGIRVLRGVISAPTLRPDGTVLSRHGYDSSTGLLLTGSRVIEIPESPTLDDAHAAVAKLMDVVADFPFVADAHKAAWLAYLLTTFSRHAFSGPAPLFLIDANTPGTGKGMLADVVAIIAIGRRAAVMGNPRDDDEVRKRITAILRAGDLLALLDNVFGGLGSPSFDAALTGEVWEDRILGRSETIKLLLLVIWAATGNNVTLAADTLRRTCHIRLSSPLQNPEQRTGFRHENLLEFVRQNRDELIQAALTILRAYCFAGRPDMGLKPWGSFEGWSKLVRQAIVWVGMKDPGETRQELVDRSDVQVGGIRDLLEGIETLDPSGAGLTTATILDILGDYPDSHRKARHAVCELCGSAPGKLPTVRSLGNKLRHIRERVIDEKCLDSKPDTVGRQVWFVRKADAQSHSTDSSDSSGSFTATSANTPRNTFEDFSRVRGAETESVEPVESGYPPHLQHEIDAF